MIVDAHVHLWDRGYHPRSFELAVARRAAARSGRSVDELLPRVMGSVVDPDGRLMIDDMNRAGIDTAVIMALDFGLACEEEASVPIEQVNRNYATLVERYDGRLRYFFGVDPRRPNAADLFQRAFEGPCPSGLKLYPSAGFHVYDEACAPLYEIASAERVPVLVDSGIVGPPMRPRFSRPADLVDVAAAFPDLTIILGHVGREAWWEEGIAVARSCPQLFLDLSSWWESRAALGAEALLEGVLRLCSSVGPGRLLWGTDRSSGPGRSGARSAWPEQLELWSSLPALARSRGKSLSDDDLAGILGGNAARLLGLQRHAAPAADAAASRSPGSSGDRNRS